MTKDKIRRRIDELDELLTDELLTDELEQLEQEQITAMHVTLSPEWVVLENKIKLLQEYLDKLEEIEDEVIELSSGIELETIDEIAGDMIKEIHPELDEDSEEYEKMFTKTHNHLKEALDPWRCEDT